MRRVVALMIGVSLAMLATELVGPTTRTATAETSVDARDNPGAADFSAVQQPEEVTPLSAAPSYCSPCLYYSGDLDTSNVNSGALADGIATFDVAYLYTPFTVPTGHWHVKKLFVNIINPHPSAELDPKTAAWAIWQDTADGVPGVLLATGMSTITATPTGRTENGIGPEYTIIVAGKVTLKAGTYFMNVLPQCSNPSNANCGGYTYESSVADTSPAHHFGPANLMSESFLASTYNHHNDTKATDINPDYTLFSFGVVGTSTKH